MADLDLVFAPDSRGPLELVFGDSGDAVTPEYTAHAAFHITGLGRTHVRAGVWANAAFRISRWPGATRGAYDYNVTRNLLAARPVAWQQAAPVAAAVRSDAQPSQPLATSRQSHFQRGLPVGAGTVARWQRSQPLQRGAVQHWQIGLPLAAAALAQFQRTIQLAAGHAQHFQRGTPTAAGILAAFQRTIQLSQGWRAAWQWGLPRAALAVQRMAAGVHIIRGGPAHWQAAMRPPPGRTIVIVPPQRPCYEPENPIHLVFDADDRAPLDLLFVCERHGPDPEPGGTIVVRAREVYRMLNTIELRRVDTGELLPTLDGFSMALDRDSYTWSFSVNLLASALPRVRPGPDRLPVELEFMVNGQPYRMLARHWRRSTVFPASVVTISGGSPNVLLAAPYAPLQSFTQASMRTARQLAEDVLAANGVSMGWALDWQIADWPIPAGTWLHRGTWMTAVNDIASAVRGYVQPHDTARTLRVLPDFPHAMWDWGSVTPDIELPNGVATVEEVEYDPRADYNAVYMRGEPGNYLYHRYRPGTAGDLVAAPVVHPLLVHADAAAQRAIAELSDTGAQLPQSLTLPILPETGIIKPGLYVGYTDDAGERRVGLVRRTQVSEAGEAAVQQTIGVLTYE